MDSESLFQRILNLFQRNISIKQGSKSHSIEIFFLFSPQTVGLSLRYISMTDKRLEILTFLIFLWSCFDCQIWLVPLWNIIARDGTYYTIILRIFMKVQLSRYLSPLLFGIKYKLLTWSWERQELVYSLIQSTNFDQVSGNRTLKMQTSLWIQN